MNQSQKLGNILKLKHIREIKRFSTKTISAIQKECWDSYLSNGRGSSRLFQAIDTNHDNFLTKEEIQDFCNTIIGPRPRTINPVALKVLRDQSTTHKINEQEFKTWLVMATKFSKLKNTDFQKSYDSNPLTGIRTDDEKDHVEIESGNIDDSDTSIEKLRPKYSWNENTINQSLRRMQYAVRGTVVMRADELKAQGRDILFTNVGNPHAVGQSPITFYRQVLALCDLPAMNGVEHSEVRKLFPKDVIERALEMRNAIGPAGTSAYTHSQGLLEFRKDVANFITERDGVTHKKSYEGHVFLSNGASTAIKTVMKALIAEDNDAIMIPIPQYPIYSAVITLLGGRQIGYELDEDLGWAITEQELDKKYQEAQEDGLAVKAFVLINPGNPTGQVMSRQELELICKFCAKHGIVLLADEVYQRNVYIQNKEFLSARKIRLETPGCKDLQLISFHSTSKGVIGECGRRGGYMHLHHIDPYVQSQIYKLASSQLCPTVSGQIMTSLMIRPPEKGGESYEQFMEEESFIFEGLKRRSQIIVEGLNSIEGISCQKAEGAMYAFPSIILPQKAIDTANDKDMTPDTLYALSLLEETGICVVPASGFGQKEGRYGFRTTFLPPEDKIVRAIDEFDRHHRLFVERYS